MDPSFQNDELKLEQIKVSSAADTAAAVPAVAEKENHLVPPEGSPSTVANTDEKKGPIKSFFAFFGNLFCWAILILGQLFMVSDIAVSTGTIASSIFGFSFDRIMYHCGAQDTFMSGFILGVLPVFWSSWYLYKRPVLRYLAMCIFGIPVSWMLAILLAPGMVAQVLVACVSFAALFFIQMAGSYLASFQKTWPRSFSVSKLLLFCYIPAIIFLGYEFSNIDLTGTVDKVPDEGVAAALGAIAAFSFLPALLNSIAVRTRRFASGLGLSSIGQLPVLISVVVYCIANGVMLFCYNIFGATAVADYFTRISGGVLTTEFELMPNNSAELWSKLLCSVLVGALVFVSVWAGSFLGVLWNRWRRKGEHSFND